MMNMRTRIIIAIVGLLALLGGGYWWWSQRAAAASADTLSGSGTIEAEDVVITSEVSGRVQSLLVDQARAGRDGSAQAYENALKALTNPQELDVQGIQAQAARDSAQRALAQVQAGSRIEDITAAEAALNQAQASLQAARDRLSAAKSQAETQVDQSALALTQAQARYSQAKTNWEYVQDTGNDPLVPKISDGKGGTKANKLSDAQRENYYAAFVQAEAALHQAEQTVAQAQVAADAARQAEVTGVQTAESQVQSSDAALAKLRNGATAESLATAQTALTNAQRVLSQALAMRKDPQQLQAAADAAKAQLDTAEA